MPQMQMQVALADGRVEQYRMFQAALESPLPLSPLPTNLDELAGLLAPDSVAEGAAGALGLVQRSRRRLLFDR
ncbi:MAG: hypothetical protein R2748_27740 [Bryobacterales bacterium]